jgi:hypothetical protein
MANSSRPGISAAAADSAGLSDVSGAMPSASSLVAPDAINFFLGCSSVGSPPSSQIKTAPGSGFQNRSTIQKRDDGWMTEAQSIAFLFDVERNRLYADN